MKSIREFYEYRELLKTNVRKDIRGRYKGSFLGVLWTFLTPLLQVLVYYLVFPYLMRGGMPNFLVYLITGIFPWNFFQSGVVGATGCIKANEGVVKKVYFPRKILCAFAGSFRTGQLLHFHSDHADLRCDLPDSSDVERSLDSGNRSD